MVGCLNGVGDCTMIPQVDGAMLKRAGVGGQTSLSNMCFNPSRILPSVSQRAANQKRRNEPLSGVNRRPRQATGSMARFEAAESVICMPLFGVQMFRA